MSEDSGTSLEAEVLDELGEGRLQEIAGLLGTDGTEAREMVGTTVSALSGEVRGAPVPEEEAPLQGVSTLGGFTAGGLLAGVLAKASKPVANAVAKKTGLPAATVTRVVELLIPVILTVLAKRGAKK
ncbi:DUF937 domain-containing protein [Streptomyces sp. NBC_00564]|uniref:DUF937 domain-containing protein n=1 Tax=Streptomyces sp. NBC_00564 TaxID=2903663 RepID=UPI00352F5056|nr:DUF937 domain-containing protein [Streptomyces sp. NBC_00564]